MGGVKTDVEGRTSVKGLYAIGEVSSTGLHGGNRLASNSLLECVVCAYEVADYLKQAVLIAPKQIDMEIKSLIDMYSEDIDAEELDIPELKKELQSIMWDYVGILRSEKSLMNALEKIEALKEHFPRIKKCLSKQEYEFKNMLTVAKLIVISALRRKESRGAHYRLDYLNTNEECVHNCLTKREGELSFVK